MKQDVRTLPPPVSLAGLRSLVLLIFAATLVASCGSESSKPPQGPPPPVEVTVAQLEDISERQTFTGRIEAIDKVQIRARVQGFIKKRHFEEGAEVRKGQLLFEIEPEPFQIAVAQAEATLASAKAALTLAEQTFARTSDLASRNTASRASLDTARATLTQAQAAVQAQQAALETAKLNLSYTRVEAPITGRVGRAAFSVGDLVGPTSSQLVTLVAQDPIYVTFPVPQRVLLEVSKAGLAADGVVVIIKLSDGSTYDHRGKISFIDVQATASTDSVVVRASIANPKRLLIDQQLVTVSVVRKAPERKLVVSQSALLLDQRGTYVLVVEPDNKVTIRRIVLGEQRGSVVVVTSGLKPGDRVIVSGHQKVRPGLVVAPHAAGVPAPGKPPAASKEAGKPASAAPAAKTPPPAK
ncbi:MAG: efflux RND transporter periplasmic adaptor subunit [Hyphomicrobiaceae bacterium]